MNVVNGWVIHEEEFRPSGEADRIKRKYALSECPSCHQSSWRRKKGLYNSKRCRSCEDESRAGTGFMRKAEVASAGAR